MHMRSKSIFAQPSPAAALLRLARMDSDLTQAELAERVGVSPGVISAYETDRRQPTLNALLRLLRAAGFDLRMHLEPYDDHDEVLAAASARFDPGELAEDKARQAERLAGAAARDDAFERSRRATRAARTRKAGAGR